MTTVSVVLHTPCLGITRMKYYLLPINIDLTLSVYYIWIWILLQIYILLYKEVALALKINSMYSKRRLLTIHENVKVLRFPNHFSAGVYLWYAYVFTLLFLLKFWFLSLFNLIMWQVSSWEDCHCRSSSLFYWWAGSMLWKVWYARAYSSWHIIQNMARKGLL